MEKIEFVKGMTYLGIAIGKQYTNEECEVFYDFLKDFSYQTFIEAIKNRIKRSSFPPKINELIEECNLNKNESRLKIVDFMNKQGYFKTPTEYEKAMLFLKRDIVPNWLQEDINKYYLVMNKQLVKKETVLIGQN